MSVPDALADASLEVGRRMARVLFNKRTPKSGVRKGIRNVEAHLSESEVATLCAAAYQIGYEARSKESGQ